MSSEIEHYLQSKVSTGFYSNASEVVRDAIRRMWEDDQKLEKLKAALQVGDEQIERGEGGGIHRAAWMQSPKKRSTMPRLEGMLALMLQDEFVIILSPQAEEDFAGILQYTLETWGDRPAGQHVIFY